MSDTDRQSANFRRGNPALSQATSYCMRAGRVHKGVDGNCVRAVSIGEWMVTVCVPCPQWSGWLLCACRVHRECMVTVCVLCPQRSGWLLRACRGHSGVDGYCVRAVSTMEWMVTVCVP